MKFLDGRKVDRIQVPITKNCNRRCPNCCAREKLSWYNKAILEPDVSIKELEKVGATIGKIARIEITGGEPTMHSSFEEITLRLSELFQCTDFMLVTNGWLFGRCPDKLPLLMKYQKVWLSHYTERFVDQQGGRVNTPECTLIEKYLREHNHQGIMVKEIDEHTPITGLPYGGLPCGHATSDMIAYFEGRLYGCCVAWSLPVPGRSIPLTADWRDCLKNMDLPCETCFRSLPSEEKS